MTELELDEILTLHWGRVIRRTMVDGDEWAQGFAKSIARHGKRRDWRPTPKQAHIMRQMVSDLGTAVHENVDLVDDAPMSPQEIAIQRVRSCFRQPETIEPMER